MRRLQCGMLLPAMLAACALWTAEPPALRPVDAVARARMGLAPPRSAEVILREIDALPERDTSQPITPEEWAELRRKSAEVAARRVALVSELEESGYAGARLGGLQRDKLIACSEVALRAYGPLNEALGIMWEVRDRHAGEPVGERRG